MCLSLNHILSCSVSIGWCLSWIGIIFPCFFAFLVIFDWTMDMNFTLLHSKYCISLNVLDFFWDAVKLLEIYLIL